MKAKFTTSGFAFEARTKTGTILVSRAIDDNGEHGVVVWLNSHDGSFSTEFYLGNEGTPALARLLQDAMDETPSQSHVLRAAANSIIHRTKAP